MKSALLFIFAAVFTACTSSVKSTHVWLTAESGEKCAEQKAVDFVKGVADGAVVVNLNEKKQTIDGFGGSLTESSAFVLACLTPERRHEIIAELFGENGANFSASRTVVGSSDFTLVGNYSFDDVEGDAALEHFSIEVHKDGFPKSEYPQIKDEHFDVNQFIHEVAELKAAQADSEWRLVASPWSPPAWMKDNGKFYDKQNRYGGALKPEYYQTFADYYVKYLLAYREEGIEFYALTPENEPQGNDGSWESLHLSPMQEAQFIAKNLGPAMEKAGFGNVKIFCFDQNIFEAGPYTAAVYGNEKANKYTTGTAMHWYGSTVSCFPEVLDSLHAAHPDKSMWHTEGCVDNLGRDGWLGVSDYEGYKESGWFQNDSFWWTPSATDWAYSTPWWPEWHPKYAVTHRYAQYIIDGLNHWLTGFIDWNIVLDANGGPTHVGNNCGAQVMIDTDKGDIYFTPYYYILKQFSRSMRPGDVVLGISEPADADLRICAVEKQDGSVAVNILNKAQEPKQFDLQIGEYFAKINMPNNSVKTIIVKL